MLPTTAGFLDCQFRKAALIGGSSLRNFSASNANGFFEEVALMQLTGSAVDAVHASTSRTDAIRIAVIRNVIRSE